MAGSEWEEKNRGKQSMYTKLDARELLQSHQVSSSYIHRHKGKGGLYRTATAWHGAAVT
jgi:hypothetical protein